MGAQCTSEQCCSRSDKEAGSIIVDQVSAVVDPLAAAPVDAESELELRGPRHYEWTVLFSKTPDSTIGLDVDFGDKVTLKVLKVKPEGLIPGYNATAAVKIQERDRIVSVNGVCGDSEKMLASLKSNGDFELVVRREHQWIIPLTREENESIGMELDQTEMTILSIHESGAVATYNKNLPEEFKRFQLIAGAKIIGVNGTSEPREMMNEMETKGSLDMVVIPPMQ